MGRSNPSTMGASLRRGVRAGLGARAAKQEAKRERLIDAAAKTIWRHGYAGCSISRVTSKARVAHGTFYLYFSSQQELFDAVLPALGAEMIREISASISGAVDFFEVEQRGFRAELEYSVRSPALNRVLWEAELYAPNAYRRYMDDIVARYTASLQRSLLAGHLPAFEQHELEMLAIMLIGARTQLTRSLAGLESVGPEQIDMVCDVYSKFIANGIKRPSGKVKA